ncbi:helix-turn-helix domain-containing protein [Leptospira noguchii]|uniref:helix-turn-helix domain-containing protein n=1 Tax=Leptospira noguchii TaxID=28182 RepID=UPI00077349B5|nr:helix-turn-helix transcriptional regulator [Leptospira noguchii]
MRHKGQGQRLNIILEETKLKSKELAEVCETDPATFSNYLLDKRDIPFHFAYKLMQEYGYSPFWLIFGDGEKFVPIELLDSLSPKQVESTFNTERDRVFQRRLKESGLLPMVEQMLELDDKERKTFRTIFDRFFPKKHR